MNCSVEGCGSRAEYRTAGRLCRKHYKRWQIHGDPTVEYVKPRTPMVERFFARVQFSDLGGCWIFRGTGTRRGGQPKYGMVRGPGREGGKVTAHRFAYELLIGPIPEGLQLDHLCRNPPCVNPLHLEPVTGSENFRRGMHPNAVRHRERLQREKVDEP